MSQSVVSLFLGTTILLQCLMLHVLALRIPQENVGLDVSTPLHVHVDHQASQTTAVGDDDTVLVWGTGFNGYGTPRVALSGLELGKTPGVAKPFDVWPNYAEVPRAIEVLQESPRVVVWGDTQGSLFLLKPMKEIVTLIPREKELEKNTDHNILSLFYDNIAHKLFYTVNTSIMFIEIQPDGSAAGKPHVAYDYAPLGVQNIVLQTDGETSEQMAYFCKFDSENRSEGASIVRALVTQLAKPQVIVNNSLSLLSSNQFGDTLPRFVIDGRKSQLYYVAFTQGVFQGDLSQPFPVKAKRVPLNTGSTSLSLKTFLSIALIQPETSLKVNNTDASLTAKANVNKANATLVVASLSGYVGAVPTHGGVVNWVSTPNSGPYYQYRQLWDFKPLTDRAAIVTTWLRVTDVTSSSATIISASVEQIDLVAPNVSTPTNYTNATQTTLYATWHRGGSGLTIEPTTCKAYWTQSYSSIYKSAIDPLQPVEVAYTYKNFRFNNAFALDTKRDRTYWFQQYDNFHVAGDNGYSIQLMSADSDDLAGRTSVLSAFCHSFRGDVSVDAITGDTVFQSSGAGSSSGVQHYCYLDIKTNKTRLFYIQKESYSQLSTAVDWSRREMYIGGNAYHVNSSNIRKVSIDASVDANKEIVVGANITAVAMGIVGDALYFTHTKTYSQYKFQNLTLFRCNIKPSKLTTNTPAITDNVDADNTTKDETPCGKQHAVELSVVPSFADQFSSYSMITDTNGEYIVVRSLRGNSVATYFARYSIEHGTWEPLWFSPFNAPAAIAYHDKQVYYIDSTFSTFAHFDPAQVNDDAPEYTPYVIDGQFRDLATIASSQPYPSGVRSNWASNFVSGAAHWYWISGYVDPASGDQRLAVYRQAYGVVPTSEPFMILNKNVTASTFLAVDEDAQEIYYVTSAYLQFSTRGCDNLHPDVLVKARLGAGGDVEPEVVYANKKGWCFGSGNPAIDSSGKLLYVDIVDQYSQFMGYDNLAIISLTSKTMRMPKYTTPRNTAYKLLRLTDDATTLWGWGCVPNQFGQGCQSRMFQFDLNTETWTNATVEITGLGDFSIQGQVDGNFVFAAYTKPSTAPTERAMYSARYVVHGSRDTAYGSIESNRRLLAPVDVANMDMDWSDEALGALIGANYLQSADGILLLRAPLIGVGRTGKNSLTPTVVPWPTKLPKELQVSSILQLAHKPPHSVLFSWGVYRCTSEELWEFDFNTNPVDGVEVPQIPHQRLSALLPQYRSNLQVSQTTEGLTQLTWMKCSSRVISVTIPDASTAHTPIVYETLEHAWLDIATDRSTSMNAMTYVGDQFVFGYSNGSIFTSTLDMETHTFTDTTLVSNTSKWFPQSFALSDRTVYIGERNMTDSNARIRSLDLAQDQPRSLELVVDDVVGVNDMAVGPVKCFDVPATVGLKASVDMV